MYSVIQQHFIKNGDHFDLVGFTHVKKEDEKHIRKSQCVIVNGECRDTFFEDHEKVVDSLVIEVADAEAELQRFLDEEGFSLALVEVADAEAELQRLLTEGESSLSSNKRGDTTCLKSL